MRLALLGALDLLLFFTHCLGVFHRTVSSSRHEIGRKNIVCVRCGDSW